jgi:hypothetical protein
MRKEGFEEAAEAMASSPPRCAAANAHTPLQLIEASDCNAGRIAEATRKALVLSMYYLVQSTTFGVVKNHIRNLEGHWMVMLYRFQSGATLLRPSFKSMEHGNVSMAPDMLHQWAIENQQDDRAAAESELQNSLRRGERLVTP